MLKSLLDVGIQINLNRATNHAPQEDSDLSELDLPLSNCRLAEFQSLHLHCHSRRQSRQNNMTTSTHFN